MNAQIFPGLYNTQKRAFLQTITMGEIEKGEDIIYTICNHLKLDIGAVLSLSRKRELVMCRQTCMHFIKTKTTLSLKAIGDILGNRDHSTIIYGIETFNDIFETDYKFRKIVFEIYKLLNV